MQSKNIKEKIDIDDIKKIFGNKENKFKYLKSKNIEFKKNISTIDLNNLIIKNWKYIDDLKLIRKIFWENKKSKYLEIFEYENLKNYLINEWKIKFNDDEIKWPFNQNMFDHRVQTLNGAFDQYSIGAFDIKKSKEVDLIIANESIKMRRIKQLNTIINDCVERIIIESNENILPTIGNNKNVDFFIDGERFDQKVSKSPTLEFKKYCKKNNYNYVEFAKKHPEIVGKFLYENQNEERFNDGYRLLVVFLGEENLKINKSLIDLKEYVIKIILEKPIEINFQYKLDKSNVKNNFKTKAIVILID